MTVSASSRTWNLPGPVFGHSKWKKWGTELFTQTTFLSE